VKDSAPKFRPWLALVLLPVLVACGTVPSPATLADVRAQANPADKARRTITNFTPALRCMDERLFERGVRDVTLMMEEMRDATLRVPVSTRDMMVSAISDMTRRSRAVRLSVFGTDQQNLSTILFQAQRSSVFQAVPRYSLRGTISQFDDGVERRNAAVGLSLVERVFGVRMSSDTKFSVLGFDAALVDTGRFTLVAGVSSKNQTVLATRDTQAGDGEARLSNPGLSAVFSFAASRSDGVAQAARNMVELAAVELVGKLLRLPYWQCLGIPDDDPEVLRETEDWFLAMDEAELRQSLQERMRELRYYNGPADGKPSAAYLQALGRFRVALGLPATGPTDLAFFRLSVVRSVPRAAAAAPAVAPPAGQGAAALTLVRRTATAEGFGFSVLTEREGYVYCYAQEPESGKIRRVFPHRFASDPHIAPDKLIQVQSSERLALSAQARYACLFAGSEVYADLPAALRWGDFDEVRATSFEDIRDAFAKASGAAVGLQRLEAL